MVDARSAARRATSPTVMGLLEFDSPLTCSVRGASRLDRWSQPTLLAVYRRRRGINTAMMSILKGGYSLSGKPKGVESDDMARLAADVAAVVKYLGRDKATIVGHDWGGAVAWRVALSMPQMTERLIILNLPHPTGLARELRT